MNIVNFSNIDLLFYSLNLCQWFLSSSTCLRSPAWSGAFIECLHPSKIGANINKIETIVCNIYETLNHLLLMLAYENKSYSLTFLLFCNFTMKIKVYGYRWYDDRIQAIYMNIILDFVFVKIAMDRLHPTRDLSVYRMSSWWWKLASVILQVICLVIFSTIFEDASHGKINRLIYYLYLHFYNNWSIGFNLISHWSRSRFVLYDTMMGLLAS